MKIKRIGLIIIAFLIIQMLCIGSVLAVDHDYTIIDGERVPIPVTYTLTKVIYNLGANVNNSGYLKNPEDIFINSQGFIYVADTGNNRIVKFSPNGETTGIYYGPSDNMLKTPEGIFVDDYGDMFIADKGNSRIIHLTSEGEFVEEFLKPESELLGSSFTFTPSKLCISPTGYIYVIKGQSILTLDANNRFRGYLGQTDIGFNLVEVLIRIFASDQQKRTVNRRTAAAYTNITIDEKGTIYATSMDMTEGEIKKMNSVGKNIYRKYTTTQNSFQLKLFNFLTEYGLENESFVFGERFGNHGPIKPLFNDITVDENGIVTVVENNTGKLYQYDQDGNLLTVFGGTGNQKGKFYAPVSLAQDTEGCIYVLDKAQGSIQAFEPTKFIKLVHEAVNMYAKGEYDESYQLWKQILNIDESYKLAHFGLGNALFKQENWKGAMDEYKLANDRNAYSKAFSEYRYAIFRKYFAIVAFAVILVIILFLKLIALLKKTYYKSIESFVSTKNDKARVLTGLGMSLGMIFHPLELLENIKERKDKLNYISDVILFLLVLIVRIIYLLTVHYPLMDVDLLESNFILEAVKLLLPPLTWIIASFAIGAILDGESKMGEVFIATSYCMVPYILIFSFLTALSNVLSRNEITLYSIIVNSTWIWILLLIFISNKALNDYTIKKSVITYSISGASMVLIWFIVLLGYILSGKLVQYVSGIIREIQIIWL